MASSNWTPVAQYVSSRDTAKRWTVRMAPNADTLAARMEPAAAVAYLEQQLDCNCPGWVIRRRNKRNLSFVCTHVKRFIERDRFTPGAGFTALVSEARHLLAQAGYVAVFNEKQLAVLDLVFEPRLIRSRVAATPSVTPHVGTAGLRMIVLDE